MKKVIIIFLVLAIFGAGLYYVNRVSEDSPSLVVDNNMKIIADAYLGSGSAVCDFIDPGYEHREDEEVTVYIKAGKMRFLYEDKSQDDEDFFANIVFKDDYYYVWNEDGGMKIGIERNEFFVPFGTENGEVYVYTDDDFRLNCRKTSVDDSMFDVPTDIDFFDMSEMMDDSYFDDYDYVNGEGVYDEDFEIDLDRLRELENMEGFEGIDMENFNIEDFLQ